MNSLSADIPDPAVMQDVAFAKADFERISEILYEISGIKMPPTNQALVFSRLSRRVRELGLKRFSDYVEHVEVVGNRDERAAMVEALTTNTTRFFREDYHFDTLAGDLMPELAESARGGARVRLWSAACSTGEEPYSMAAVVLKHFPDAGKHDFRILATDINRQVLARAERGEYPSVCAEGITADMARLMFEPTETGTLRIRETLRSLVSFRYMNFMEPWPVRGPFAAIFCRNVMIYMEDSTQARVWAGLASVMRQGGHLFIGHSERIGPEFKDQLQLVGKTTFQRI